jgi:hypothetical protein
VAEKNQALETSSKCAGCTDEIDLFKNHLVITVKTQKQALVTPPPTQREDTTKVEAEEETAPYLGTRSGEGEILLFHAYGCAADYFEKKRDKTVKLNYNQDDTDPYNPEEAKK